MSILTFLLLAVSFIALHQTIRNRTFSKSFLLYLALFVSAFPLAYALYDDAKHPTADANIGLGLAFFLTWGITAGVAIVAFVKYLDKRKKA
ncbi:hypothetical protein GA0061096_3672 [Fictibacillus enclensis]|uniref:Uncharacterized protein n=1 Tax=Fictibacillus enclensis TaxID=1017270 RepID=A0A0V8J5W2_9BACL|nr:hypothetical protein [Fictibacillus enclensis]KSU82064.1 hypothetical protein AS030_17470 [Fictibacillus enclensis]SCC29755.1 hypothetical protein GA0061096_3672 [Fictibacillus enclensis]